MVDKLCDQLQKPKRYKNLANYLCRLLKQTVFEDIQIYDLSGNPCTKKCYTILLSATNTKSANSCLIKN
ncbi:MAG: hypothetical protein O7C59_05770 [Rickettsia endosymbiont of Ixodes persulcatus]|nr:hypothetical protein [Rickettsia endosymbiont of Ixodes persulcatus]